MCCVFLAAKEVSCGIFVVVILCLVGDCLPSPCSRLTHHPNSVGLAGRVHTLSTEKLNSQLSSRKALPQTVSAVLRPLYWYMGHVQIQDIFSLAWNFPLGFAVCIPTRVSSHNGLTYWKTMLGPVTEETSELILPSVPPLE